MTITSYAQPNDTVQLWFDPALKALLSIEISTYLGSPSDVVKAAIQFGKLPDGTTHISSMNVNGEWMQLLVKVTNGGYQKL